MDAHDRKLAVAAEEIDLRTWRNTEAEVQDERARKCRSSSRPVSSAEHAATLESYACLLRRIGGMQFMAEELLGKLDEDPTSR